MSAIASFDNRVAVITGAGRGLGRAYALEIARRGAKVVVNDIGVSDLGIQSADEVVGEITASGGQAVASYESVTTAEGGESLIHSAIQRFGKVDVLINNAGFLRGSTFCDMTVRDLHDVVGIHLLGAFYTTLPAWKVMCANRYGRIVMTGSSSVFGHVGNSNYSAAKSGMLGLTHSLALEGREYGIGVNCVFPTAKSQIAAKAPLVGPHRDRIVAALNNLEGRHTPALVAQLVTFLASSSCTESGSVYSAMAGRFARIFVGLGRGWYGGDAASVENVAEQWSAINDISSYSIPGNLIDELELVGNMIKPLKNTVAGSCPAATGVSGDC